MVAETNGSNGFYRLQTFEQKLLARAYGILGFLLRLQINSEDTVAADIKGSNGFYRLQTFEQN